MIAANYTGGSFSIAPINKDGSIAADKKVIQHEGKSINKERQEKHIDEAIKRINLLSKNNCLTFYYLHIQFL